MDGIIAEDDRIYSLLSNKEGAETAITASVRLFDFGQPGSTILGRVARGELKPYEAGREIQDLLLDLQNHG
jgi:hypothetical protein